MTTESVAHAQQGEIRQQFDAQPHGMQRMQSMHGLQGAQARSGQAEKPNRARIGLAAKLVFSAWGYTVTAMRDNPDLKERFMADVTTLYDVLGEAYDRLEARGAYHE